MVKPSVDELKDMLIPVKEWKEMVVSGNKVVSLEEFIKGQSYNLPKFGDSVDVINAKLKQLSINLSTQGVHLEFSGLTNLCESVKELVKDSPSYKVDISYEDSDLDSAISSFKIEVVKR